MKRNYILTAAISLLIGSALGSFAGFIYYAPILQSSQLQVSNLTLQVTNLTSQVLNLEQTATDQEAQISSLESDYHSLELEYGSLTADYKSLKYDYEGLQYALREAEREAEANKFMFYYVQPKQKYGVYLLEEALSRWQWKEDLYKANLFDCSEMSAALERLLENEGFHTVIVAGESPFGEGYHAWLLVELAENQYMPVEATAWSIVYWGSPYFDNYFDYYYQFEGIEEALAYNPTEFDWWE